MVILKSVQNKFKFGADSDVGCCCVMTVLE